MNAMDFSSFSVCAKRTVPTMPSSEIVHWRTWSANLLVDLSCSTARTQMSAIFRRAGKRKYLSSKLHVNLKFATGHSHGWILSGWRLVPMMRFCLLLLCFLVIRIRCTVLYCIRAIWTGNQLFSDHLAFLLKHSLRRRVLELHNVNIELMACQQNSSNPSSHLLMFDTEMRHVIQSASQPASACTKHSKRLPNLGA